jgi:hypothetical protein
LRGKKPFGSEEQADQVLFDGDKGYKAALLSTLKRTREMLAEGQALTITRNRNCGTTS